MAWVQKLLEWKQHILATLIWGQGGGVLNCNYFELFTTYAGSVNNVLFLTYLSIYDFSDIYMSPHTIGHESCRSLDL